MAVKEKRESNWLINQIFSAVKTFQPISVNRLTDGEICSNLHYLYESFYRFSIIYKGPFKNQLPKTAYIDTNTKYRVV